ncbi:MAG: tetratricopeptide repeat protein [Myxococcota bacterium]
MRFKLVFLVIFLILFSFNGIGSAQDTADNLAQQGDAAYAEKNYDKAIELYKASLKINGKNWRVHESLGNAYFKAKRYPEAAASYAEALGYNPQLVSAYYNIGYSYLKAGLFNEAIKYLEKYISLKSDDPDGVYRLAEAYYSVGEKENAIKNYEKFLSMANKDVKQSKIDDAKAKLNELKGSSKQNPAVVVAPIPSTSQPATTSTPALSTPSISAPSVVTPSVPAPATAPSPVTSFAKQSTNTTPPTENIKPDRQPTQSTTNNANTSDTSTMKTATLANDPAYEIVKEADGHLANGNYRLAISTYRDALIRNPNSIQAHYNLGIALAKIDRLEQAISEWEKVLQLDPNNSGAKENINRAKARLSGKSSPSPDQSSQVAAQTSQSSQPAPQQSSPVNDLLAKANKANSVGDYAGAIKYIDELMVIKKDVAEAYVVRGDALLGMARYLDAINEYKKALALNPQLADPLFGMAESYRLLAKADMAIQYYKLFLNSPSQDKAKWRVERASKMLKALESIR